MVKRLCILVPGLLLCLAAAVSAQDDVTIVAPATEAAEGLDLTAVSQLFKDSENLEEFEKSLNDPDEGINNLDLNEDGYVDYIRVVEDVTDATHIIILQAMLDEDDYQDVATIEVEQSEDDYNMQVHGNEVLYGSAYYVAPTVVHIHTWPIIRWMYRPAYRPYVSVYRFGFYPRWWKPFPRVTHTVYHKRLVPYRRRPVFSVRRTSVVKSVHVTRYKPRNSVTVTKRVTKVSPARRTSATTVTKTTVTKTKPRTRNVTASKSKTVSKSVNKSSTRVKKPKTVKKKTVTKKSGNKTVTKSVTKTRRTRKK